MSSNLISFIFFYFAIIIGLNIMTLDTFIDNALNSTTLTNTYELEINKEALVQLKNIQTLIYQNINLL